MEAPPAAAMDAAEVDSTLKPAVPESTSSNEPARFSPVRPTSVEHCFGAAQPCTLCVSNALSAKPGRWSSAFRHGVVRGPRPDSRSPATSLPTGLVEGGYRGRCVSVVTVSTGKFQRPGGRTVPLGGGSGRIYRTAGLDPCTPTWPLGDKHGRWARALSFLSGG